jgi:Zn finger protein HypA/HybF involved in hydrogenase expression
MVFMGLLNDLKQAINTATETHEFEARCTKCDAFWYFTREDEKEMEDLKKRADKFTIDMTAHTQRYIIHAKENYKNLRQCPQCMSRKVNVT